MRKPGFRIGKPALVMLALGATAFTCNTQGETKPPEKPYSKVIDECRMPARDLSTCSVTLKFQHFRGRDYIVDVSVHRGANHNTKSTAANKYVDVLGLYADGKTAFYRPGKQTPSKFDKENFNFTPKPHRYKEGGKVFVGPGVPIPPPVVRKGKPTLYPIIKIFIGVKASGLRDYVGVVLRYLVVGKFKTVELVDP